MVTIQEILKKFEDSLEEIYPREEIKQLFLLSYSQVTGKKPIQYSLEHKTAISDVHFDFYENVLQQLKTAKPIQHILGEAPFYGRVFAVNDQTLIPRPETEELVDLIIKDNLNRNNLTFVDIGTGSGCIAISLAKEIADATGFAIEVSDAALEIARKNAKKHNVNINFIHADISEWDYFMQENMKFDIIVSNPPYITSTEKLEMHNNVLQYEPHSALFVEDHAPLYFYDIIADMGLKHLHATGSLYFEINQYLAIETKDLLHKKGYTNIHIYKDINGADRMIKAQLTNPSFFQSERQ
ncbi:peptide chain release factor N(5)-glutamine methyltransferase [Sphingobacterium sp. UT-1RO-CII-1]|uniref:peptide chain release factor N(5)-glutamine methyltransferase n=1 Tax=Sphingobacterium sp. UT-1RO-CII-1 TaxID=2995225 RepID=UPI00227CC208|nr:peptide chain release factor N(5)-glutamine methyltransferase [Sphingobacterium sp. UT-1RO-CII-1]MCY4780580.1 peptide chain release factor N(5)-glutamine methyltransferase [Sphingobacterium sp. UT-1RO-CII-1]